MSRLTHAADTGAVDDGTVVYAAVLPDGPIFVLADEAAVVWRSVAQADHAVPASDENARALLAAGLLTLEKES